MSYINQPPDPRATDGANEALAQMLRRHTVQPTSTQAWRMEDTDGVTLHRAAARLLADLHGDAPAYITLRRHEAEKALQFAIKRVSNSGRRTYSYRLLLLHYQDRARPATTRMPQDKTVPAKTKPDRDVRHPNDQHGAIVVDATQVRRAVHDAVAQVLPEILKPLLASVERALAHSADLVAVQRALQLKYDAVSSMGHERLEGLRAENKLLRANADVSVQLQSIIPLLRALRNTSVDANPPAPNFPQNT